MKVIIPRLDKNLFDFGGASRRSQDWSPLEPTLRGIILSGLSGSPSTKSSKSSGMLDKSIQGLGVWRMTPKSVEWGTSVPYVYPVMGQRKKAGKPQIFLMGKGVQRQVTEAVIKYILDGRR